MKFWNKDFLEKLDKSALATLRDALSVTINKGCLDSAPSLGFNIIAKMHMEIDDYIKGLEPLMGALPF